MKYIHNLLFVLSISILLTSCGGKSGFNLSGTVQNAANLSANFDRVKGDNSGFALTNSELDNAGNFDINVAEGLDAGIYKLSIGAKSVYFVHDGKTNDITLNADLKTMDKFDYNVTGSPLTTTFQTKMSDLLTKKTDFAKIQNYLGSEADPLVGLAISNVLLSGVPTTVPLQENILNKLKTSYPNAGFVGEFGSHIAKLKSQPTQNSSRGKFKVNVGDQAPDIAMAGLNGKTQKLSDLKGKVVLLDFWASWCRPCRRANPHVVDMYQKYNDKGFTVFSVSLDGVDSRTKQRIGDDVAKYEQMMAQSKKRWEDAIAADKLTWNNHVSDLKKWENAGAGLYGVRSIPATFLIDQEGNIAALNPKGSKLEAEIQKLL